MCIRARISRFLWFALVCATGLRGQPPVTTAQYDNRRTGANLQETILTPRNVNSAKFGKLFVLDVDGDVYAQPLYVPRLEIAGKGVHDTIFVATERDSVYAFDAAEPGDPLWRVSFLKAGVNPVRSSDVHCSFIGPDLGITGTPVIDLAARTMYLVARTSERAASGELFYQRLHALDIATGQERPGSPVLIRASVMGSTWFGLVKSEVKFHAALENPRAALLLSKGMVYIAWGSSCDAGPYYGWVLAYDARTLKQTGVFNTAPDAGESGIWQSDAGIAGDDEGNIYAITGNGKFSASRSGGRDYGDSVLKLGFANGSFGVRDYFTPYDESKLNRADDDLGSTGPVLLPDQPGAHPHLMTAAGKTGMLYLIDRDRMGQYQSSSDRHAVQTLKVSEGGVFGAPAYWNRHLFIIGNDGILRDLAMADGRLSPAHQSSFTYKSPGAVPAISANGTNDAIVWAVLAKGRKERDGPAIVQAYDAADVTRLLYTTERDERSAPGLPVRYAIPTVVNGRVYVGCKNAVYVYGLRK